MSLSGNELQTVGPAIEKASSSELQCSADSEVWRQLHSTSSSSLTVRRTRLSTVGDRAFPVAAARTWNSLPQHVTSAPSVCFPRTDEGFPLQAFLSLTHYHNYCSACTVTVVIFGHYNCSFYFLTYNNNGKQDMFM